MTAGIDDSQKFRIYISPLTQLNIDPHNRISTTDARMLRRIVRDHQFRGWPADTTIMSWDKVRAGERVNIFPYTQQADVFFNSHLLYELPVLKKYAAPLLREIERKNPAYGEARRILDFLDFFVELEDDSGIPNNSIMREFIGGSVVV
jgi:uridine kinase